MAALTVWMFASGFATRAEAAGADGVPSGIAADASAVASVAGCPTRVSCGFRCEAQLVSGFCVLAVKWSGSVNIGPIQIGPGFEVECSICECWYTYTSAAGYEIFKRTTKLGCTSGLPGVDLVVE